MNSKEQMLKYVDTDIVFQEIPDEVTLAVNLRSYEQTGWLKWAYSYRGGDYGQQRAFALLVTDWYTPGMGDAGAVTHSMAFCLPYAVIGFLVVALALYLMLWLASLLTGGREKE